MQMCVAVCNMTSLNAFCESLKRKVAWHRIIMFSIFDLFFSVITDKYDCHYQ